MADLLGKKSVREISSSTSLLPNIGVFISKRFSELGGLYGYQQGVHRVSNALGGDTDSLLIESSSVTGLPPR